MSSKLVRFEVVCIQWKSGRAGTHGQRPNMKAVEEGSEVVVIKPTLVVTLTIDMGTAVLIAEPPDEHVEPLPVLLTPVGQDTLGHRRLT